MCNIEDADKTKDEPSKHNKCCVFSSSVTETNFLAMA